MFEKIFSLINPDKGGDFEGQLSPEARNAEVDSKEENKRQELTSGKDQKILFPLPRTKYLQQRKKEQNVNPIPVPRKTVSLQQSLTLDETHGIEKHTTPTPNSTSIKKNDIAVKEKNEESSASEGTANCFFIYILFLL